jgi:hypothetical protein
VEQTVGIPPEVDLLHVVQTADEQRGADEQHHGQCGLRHEQAGTQPRTIPTAFALARLERRVHVRAHGVDRWGQPGQEPCEQHDGRREQHHARIEDGDERPIHVRQENSANRPTAPMRQRQPEDAAQHRDDDAFREQLCDQPPTSDA